MDNFAQVCNTLAAARCLNAGQSLEEVAKAAGRSPATILRWLHAAGWSYRNSRVAFAPDDAKSYCVRRSK